ncbi:class I SAM-dependent methyltransferase [Ectothiorhodospira lacustris]|uniref:class I SAM-dependent methyltransferase n=1 Tax=Ectothiorhodospira lacustris TaxID=2899127 RepID=UPI001EE87265|nr:class I SAM-dependent methyltransferase [Ectothiorhodospira lacustris]MCG5510654.1 class I SAM-dependent methyltransferase [Ectothiorhodospira lacustris]MCG5522446.1 class I SAM-dependent methyltransferase [Ectothiorhodospira lacustris]
MELKRGLVDYINSELFGRLEGACNIQHLVAASLVDYFQKTSGVTGSIGEIGVRDGKLIFGMSFFLESFERCAAIDLFESQHLNVDMSGFKPESHGNPFELHHKSFLPSERWSIVDGDSLGLTLLDKFNLLNECDSFRMFSIDGGHDPEHVINDMNFVNDLMCSGGVLMIDDYYNIGFPGVHEGLLTYLKSLPKWKPFMYSHNKLFLCTHTYHPIYSVLLEKYVVGNSEYLVQDWYTRKKVRLGGNSFRNVEWSRSGIGMLMTASK